MQKKITTPLSELMSLNKLNSTFYHPKDILRRNLIYIKGDQLF